MPAYHQGATRVHSEDEEKRRVAAANEERKARERADKAAYELMMEEEAKPKEGPDEKSTKKKKKKKDKGKKENHEDDRRPDARGGMGARAGALLGVARPRPQRGGQTGVPSGPALRGACSESLAIITTSLTMLSRAQSGTSAPTGLRASAAAFTPGEKVHKRC